MRWHFSFASNILIKKAFLVMCHVRYHTNVTDDDDDGSSLAGKWIVKQVSTPKSFHAYWKKSCRINSRKRAFCYSLCNILQRWKFYWKDFIKLYELWLIWYVHLCWNSISKIKKKKILINFVNFWKIKLKISKNFVYLREDI